MKKSLRITEIFYSLQGETHFVGLPTVFIRLTGCPLRCSYCDTKYAFSGGKLIAIDEIVAVVRQFNPIYVTVTGGEPLAQADCHTLLSTLCDQGYQVSLETSGALDVSAVDPRVIKILDLKTPGSLQDQHNYLENLQFLYPDDQIKFVICDRTDYEWSKAQIEKYQLVKKCQLLFSPAHGQLENKDLAEWILEDRLPVRFQLQLHKYIWGDVRGK